MTRPPDPGAGIVMRLHRTGEGTFLPPPAVMIPALDDLERARAARTADAARRASFIAGRYVQRVLVAEMLGIQPARLTSRYTCTSCGAASGAPDHGRPGYTLDGEPVPLALSLSRAAGFVLLAALDPGGSGIDAAPAIGVDLESVLGTAFDGFDEVALTGSERRLVGRLPEHHRAAARARLWARKEALVKAIGTGFAGNGPDTVQVLRDSRIADVPAVDGIALEPTGLVAAVALLPVAVG